MTDQAENKPVAVKDLNKVEVCKAKNGKWLWRVLSPSGDTICESGEFDTKQKAMQVAWKLEEIVKNSMLVVMPEHVDVFV